jgi:hypothetical protein
MKKILYISFMALFFMGCDERLEELNIDRRNPAEVDPSSLFTQGLRESVDMMTNLNVNTNPFRLYAQQHAQTTYPDESQYNLVGRSIPARFWAAGYRDVLIDLKTAKELLRESQAAGTSGLTQEVAQNRIAAINITMSYTYAVLVDVFGDIPYTEALNPEETTPKYDDARTVYNAVLDSLEVAASAISPDVAGFAAAQDPLYGGDMAQWYKFANSIRLRLGMRLADVDKAASVAIVNDAVADGVFESNADNAAFQYFGSAPNTNPIYADLVLSGRADFVAANTIVDIMNELNDPRRSVYFRENLGTGVFEGGTYGDANSYAGFTQVGDILHTPDLPGVLMNYAEVRLTLAEAVERGGYNVSGTAAQHYHAGIMASINQWGLSDAEAEAYISQPDVNYATAGGGWEQKIGEQLWLAQYNQGFDAWTTWRRLDFEGFTPPPGMEFSDIPLRFPYPLEEAQLNGENYEVTTVDMPIFWDTEQPLL